LPFRTIYFDQYNLGQRAINLTSTVAMDPNKRRIAVTLSGPVTRAGYTGSWSMLAMKSGI